MVFIPSSSMWPVILSLTLFSNFIFLKGAMDSLVTSSFITILSVFNVLAISAIWSSDLSSESVNAGSVDQHFTKKMKLGFAMFILSEVMFFFSFFWSFFHYGLNVLMDLGFKWPGLVDSLNPYHLPLLNSFLLLGSGLVVSWGHTAYLLGKLWEVEISVVFTMIMGLMFMSVQFYEYSCMSYSFCDSVFGSIFFLVTGFHGSHVLVGLLCLCVSLIILLIYSSSSEEDIVGLELSIWYWHFVDVIWLFLFTIFYWVV